MGDEGSLKNLIDALRRGMKRVARGARSAAIDADGSGVHNVNVTGRTNVVVSKNVGGDGESHVASSHQEVRIRQDGGETLEEVETTETTR